MELILENVRCFAGKHIIPIKPLTILLGENSSGKSTLLAALSAICDPVGFPMQPNINEPPYRLGGFDTIATYKGGRYGRASLFSLGHRVDSDDKKDASTVLADYLGFQGRVTLYALSITTPVGNVYVVLEKAFQGYKVRLELPDSGKTEPIEYVIDRAKMEGRGLDFVREMFFYVNEMALDNPLAKHVSFDAILKIWSFVSRSGLLANPLSIAPVRTRPRRTYDQITENFTPEGDHIPFILARILTEYPSSKQRKPLVLALERFGKESGLFKEIGVKRLGNKAGDPFQVTVTVAGRPANMLDVGYGVSQTLPVVVQSVLAAEERLLLLQQPEVHLHPKAQAAL